MDHHIHIFSRLTTTIFLLVSINLPQSHCEEDGKYWDCIRPYKCGNLGGIFYPFWADGIRPSYCGGGDQFKLLCDDNEDTWIRFNSQDFLLHNISPVNHTMIIEQKDLLNAIHHCSSDLANTTFYSTLFHYTQNIHNITIFFNCSSPLSINASSFLCPPPIDDQKAFYMDEEDLPKFLPQLNNCKRRIQVQASRNIGPGSHHGIDALKQAFSGGFEVSYYGADFEKCQRCVDSIGACGRNAINQFACYPRISKRGTRAQNYSLNECQFMVNAPVNMKTVVNFTRLLQMNYTEVLKMGFLLNWTEPHCQQCEKSGGRCGFDDNQFPCFCKDKSYLKSCGGTSILRKIILGIASAILTALLMCIVICCLRFKSLIRQIKHCLTTKSDLDIEAFLRNHEALAQKRYKFSEVKKMTNSFEVKLGQGGFGAVYKGKLPNAGCPVAVKLLNASKGNGEEFINEVASISRTSHVNVVTLVGFCLEGRKKALIYEFMANGSLDKFIYKKGPENIASLSWESLYQITIGIARGLEYLHRGCNTRIVHFDIKPHNILLDENFCPKISDFGLAKLCPRNKSIVSMSDARGTFGYLAPEMWNRRFGGVSHKSDVYSYGMILLDMVEGRNNTNVEANHSSEIYFLDCIYNNLEQSSLRPDEVTTTEEIEIIRKITVVGLWCIQTVPNERPTMTEVIDMLEGSRSFSEIPPKPNLSFPTRSIEESFTS